MPQSNKRTADLPNPCPVGLHGMCQATSLRWTHTWRDPHLLSHARSMHYQDTHPSVTLASIPKLGPHHAGIPVPWQHHQIHDHWDPCPQAVLDPSLEPVPQLARIPAPSLSSLHFRPCWTPATCGTTRPPSLGLPAPQALLCSSSMWNEQSLSLLGQAPAWCETAASTSPPGAPSLGWSQPQLYRLSS
jgi:hypothetical protein